MCDGHHHHHHHHEFHASLLGDTGVDLSTTIAAAAAVTVLDGGMGRELKRRGAPFRQPEWSALSLINPDGHEHVYDAHMSFIAAGSEVITTNSYALVPFHIGDDTFAASATRLAGLAGKIAHAAAKTAPGVLVAASLPPLFGSYVKDGFDSTRAPLLSEPLIRGLSPYADIWLAETLSCTEEARHYVEALKLKGQKQPIWLSFTLREEPSGGDALIDDTGILVPRLRGGESLVGVIEEVSKWGGVSALLFNCSRPEIMGPAIRLAKRLLPQKIELGVYANLFEPVKEESANTIIKNIRQDVQPSSYADFAKIWIEGGATIIGGCCGVGPEHIQQITAQLSVS